MHKVLELLSNMSQCERPFRGSDRCKLDWECWDWKGREEGHHFRAAVTANDCCLRTADNICTTTTKNVGDIWRKGVFSIYYLRNKKE